MAAIDFPASPTTGQTFTAPNGVIYQYDGVKWVVAFSPTGMVSFKTNAINGQTIAQWTEFTVSWASIDFNNGGGVWDGTTYTVKTAGLYMLDWSLGLNWPSNSTIYAAQQETRFYINGVLVTIASLTPAVWQGPLQEVTHARWIGQLAVNDTIQFRGIMGTFTASLITDKKWTWASIVRLGS